MKKQLLITALLIFAVLASNAQNRNRRNRNSGEFELGIGLGLNLSNASLIDGTGSTPSKISFNAGVSGEYYFSDKWGFKAKLIYDNKGWTDGFIMDKDTNERIITDFKLSYITLPVMANWHFGSKRNWYLNFGPYLGFLVSAVDSELGSDLKKKFKSTDVGIAYGIGHKFEINRNVKLYLEYDAQSAFFDVFEENAGSAAAKNGRSSLNIGMLFRL